MGVLFDLTYHMHMAPSEVMELEVHEIRWMHAKLKDEREKELKEMERIRREMGMK
jgi:hypothetical protein